MSGLEKSSRSQLSSPSQNYYSDDDFDLYPHPPRGKRLAPVGAASNEDEISNVMAAYSSEGQFNLENSTSDNNQLEERLKQMEEDQEELNSSLMSLTSHFAKVIFTSPHVLRQFPTWQRSTPRRICENAATVTRGTLVKKASLCIYGPRTAATAFVVQTN